MDILPFSCCEMFSIRAGSASLLHDVETQDVANIEKKPIIAAENSNRSFCFIFIYRKKPLASRRLKGNSSSKEIKVHTKNTPEGLWVVIETVV